MEGRDVSRNWRRKANANYATRRVPTFSMSNTK